MTRYHYREMNQVYTAMYLMGEISEEVFEQRIENINRHYEKENTDARYQNFLQRQFDKMTVDKQLG